MVLVYGFAKGADLTVVEQQLSHNQIVFEIVQTETEQELWIQDENWLPSVKSFCVQYVASQKQRLTLANLKQTPVVFVLLIVTAVVALFTQLGEQFRDWFFIADIQYVPRTWQLYDGVELIWHSISPIFLHFSIEHVIFNALMFWYLGSCLERLLGHVQLVVLLIFLAVLSNYVQLLLAGPLFGGLSGVVYGLLVFAFCYQFLKAPLYLPKGLFYFAMVWMALGFTPIFYWLGLGNMANAAHVSGALGGLLYFSIFKILGVKDYYES